MFKKTLIARKLRNNPIGEYFPDFVCLKNKLIVELDGGQHFESIKDYQRDTFFRQEGFTVLRFWNSEVFENISGVMEKILSHYE